MRQVASVSDLPKAVADIRRQGRTLALVPTMGFLHAGHLSLVDLARRHADVAALSIFVNPTQFGPGEDFTDYPRDLERDLRLAQARGVELAFSPDVQSMYPDGTPQVTVQAGAMAERLCGAFRPGHFDGVLTVVAKLFGLFRPDVAVFGRKDFQQAVLIRRMAYDLDMGVRVELGPIAREADGLAMSSRNSYLDAEQRGEAPRLYDALQEAKRMFKDGETDAPALLGAVQASVSRSPLLTLQYAEIVDPETLGPLDSVGSGAVLALAAFCGETRLIDNVELA
jgi:pantoate--beta-alanine ligase